MQNQSQFKKDAAPDLDGNKSLSPLQIFVMNVAKRKIALSDSDVSFHIAPFISKADLILIYKKVASLFGRLDDLNPGQGIRVKKDNNSTPRTFVIIKGYDGEFKLILDTKSKLSFNVKNAVEIFSGKYKKGKCCWRIDTEVPEQYVNMVTVLEGSPVDLAAVNEVVVSSVIKKSSRINVSYNIEYNTSAPGVGLIAKTSQYSPRALYDLQVFLEGCKEHLNERLKLEIAREIILSIQELHDAGFVWQDLKALNVLLYDGPNCSVKICDFGLTAKEGSKFQALATDFYQSPEIAHLYACKDSAFHEYFFNMHVPSYGRECYLAKQDSLLPYTANDIEGFKYQRKANDMWACGVMLHEVFFGYLPSLNRNNINDSPLLLGLLSINEMERFTVGKALECVDSLLEELIILEKKKSNEKAINSENSLCSLGINGSLSCVINKINNVFFDYKSELVSTALAASALYTLGPNAIIGGLMFTDIYNDICDIQKSQDIPIVPKCPAPRWVNLPHI